MQNNLQPYNHGSYMNFQGQPVLILRQIPQAAPVMHFEPRQIKQTVFQAKVLQHNGQ